MNFKEFIKNITSLSVPKELAFTEEEFRQRIAGAQVVDVRGAGHMVAGDQNDVFLDALTSFLRTL